MIYHTYDVCVHHEIIEKELKEIAKFDLINRDIFTVTLIFVSIKRNRLRTRNISCKLMIFTISLTK